ncbi:MAG: GNAT family N-acetyltransferase [Coriobacteriales bacterium]|nr:GNAT family N-acetyltransferase [Coriobacteriales bacterium]
MDWPITLQTERLVLRPWEESDAESLYRYASDPDIGPRAGWPVHKSVEESRQAIRDVLAVPQTFAITLRDAHDSGAPVGAIGLKIGEASDLAIGSDQAELGYWIGKPLWGRGYMPEAVREVMRHGFCDLGLEAIWAGHTHDNDQSRRVQEKTGFNRQRSIRDRPRKLVGDYKTEDVNWITRGEWELLQKADPVDAATIRAQQDEADSISGSLPLISYVRSGGQTGADRGALDAARSAGVPICGWCPPGGLAEDMLQAPGLLSSYPELKEGASQGYVERTAWNVRDSHATLIIAPAGLEPKSGTEMTLRFAEDYGRPCLVIRSIGELDAVRTWLSTLGRGITLNVAGPRESKTPGTYALTKQIVGLLLA